MARAASAKKVKFCLEKQKRKEAALFERSFFLLPGEAISGVFASECSIFNAQFSTLKLNVQHSTLNVQLKEHSSRGESPAGDSPMCTSAEALCITASYYRMIYFRRRVFRPQAERLIGG